MDRDSDLGIRDVLHVSHSGVLGGPAFQDDGEVDRGAGNGLRRGADGGAGHHRVLLRILSKDVPDVRLSGPECRVVCFICVHAVYRVPWGQRSISVR